MKLSILAIALHLLFLSIQEQGTTADESSTSSPKFNGQCDLESCACVVNVQNTSSEGCPLWMEDESGVIAGTALAASEACTAYENSLNGGPGQVACYRVSSSAIQEYPIFGVDCNSWYDSFNSTTDVPNFTAMSLQDGFDGEILVEYDEVNLPPECPWDKPEEGTEPPTAAPTTSSAESKYFSFGCFLSSMMMVFNLVWYY